MTDSIKILTATLGLRLWRAETKCQQVIETDNRIWQQWHQNGYIAIFGCPSLSQSQSPEHTFFELAVVDKP